MVLFTNEAFGAKLLEAITAGLYDGNLNCLREYVQNSIDSGATRVNVNFENRVVLAIEDNGCGMNRKELEKSLYLGKSEKSEKEIGWRGIGIWSGVPTCRRIVIITKKQNFPKLRIEINADRLRQQYELSIPAVDVLTDVTGDIEKLDLGKDESIKETHFTIIRLEELLANQVTIFTRKNIEDYLSRNVPLPFDTTKFILGKEINKKLRENGVTHKEIDLFFEKKPIFRPPYSDEPFFGNIIEKTFVVEGQTVAYGWLLSSTKNRQLTHPNRGVHFKKKGVTIGDANLVAALRKKGNYNQWQYGEIHIVTNSLKENAPRNNFEANNDIIKPFYDQVGDFIGSLQAMNNYQSQNVVTKKIEQIKKHVDVDEVKKAKEEINNLKKRLQRNRAFPKEDALQKMKPIIDNKATENKIALRKLDKQVQKKISEELKDPVRERTERFNEFIKTTHPRLKKHLQKTTKKGKMEFNIDAMDPVKTMLQQKTGLTLDTICKLSRRAYDWKSVEKGDNGPLLKLSTPYRDRHFGVLIYTLHDLFVNTSKHEKGDPTSAYFDSMSETEKIELMTDFHMAQDLILRLIEKSEKIHNP